MKIDKITAIQILDSRGNPTLKVIVSASMVTESFEVPSGASTGKLEAVELRDGGKKFLGKGVLKAVKKVEEDIAGAVVGMDVFDQKGIDQTMLNLDDTSNKSNLGGNSTIGVSVACVKVAAKLKRQEVYEHLQDIGGIETKKTFPYLYMNMVNGGKHVSDGNQLEFQEFHVVPMVHDITKALDIGVSIKSELKEMLIKEFGPEAAGLGDEGGFAPNIEDEKVPLQLLVKVIEKLGYRDKVKLALDVAASSFYEDGSYTLDKKKITPKKLLEIYGSIIKEFPILSIEDPFEEEDFANFAKMIKSYPETIIVGDDLTVTNPARVREAMKKNSIGGVIIKPNQIGTVSETLEAIKICQENDIKCIVSHRSGETNSTFISDLAYAFSCFGIKAGAPQRGERVAKYNRFLEIEHEKN